MKCEFTIVVYSLYPKRRLQKVFHYFVRRVKHLSFDICFSDGKIKRFGNMRTFEFDRYCFLQELMTNYCGSL